MKHSFHEGSCSNCKTKSGHMNRYSGSGVSMQLCNSCLRGNTHVPAHRGIFSFFESAWSTLRKIIDAVTLKFKTGADEKRAYQSDRNRQIIYTKRAKTLPQNKAAQNPQLMR